MPREREFSAPIRVAGEVWRIIPRQPENGYAPLATPVPPDEEPSSTWP